MSRRLVRARCDSQKETENVQFGFADGAGLLLLQRRQVQ